MHRLDSFTTYIAVTHMIEYSDAVSVNDKERLHQKSNDIGGFTERFEVLLNCLQVIDGLAHQSRVTVEVAELHSRKSE